jgi:hypothetical protein
MGFGVGVWVAGWRGARAVKTVADSLGKSHDDYFGDVRCKAVKACQHSHT